MWKFLCAHDADTGPAAADPLCMCESTIVHAGRWGRLVFHIECPPYSRPLRDHSVCAPPGLRAAFRGTRLHSRDDDRAALAGLSLRHMLSVGGGAGRVSSSPLSHMRAAGSHSHIRTPCESAARVVESISTLGWGDCPHAQRSWPPTPGIVLPQPQSSRYHPPLLWCTCSEGVGASA